MAYLTIHEMTGDPADLLDRKRTHFDPVTRAIAPGYGALWSITAQTLHGLLVVNAWESSDRVGEFTQRPEIQEAQRASGLPAPSRFERYEDASIELYRRGGT